MENARLPLVLALLTTAGCVLEVPETTINGRADLPDASAPALVSATMPTEAHFRATAAGLPRPWTLTTARVGDGPPMLALARREGDAWVLTRLLADHDAALPEGCAELPCPWPASLVPERPLTEAAPLSGELRDAVAYARTLLAFEGPLDLPADEDESWIEELPDGVWTDPASADLAPYLERLRRYHPMGYCSMDSRPQLAAQMRARAAAQAGHTGWAVQGWADTVGYWSSSRMAWSSYGQSHPEGHLQLLEMVGVDPRRLVLGLLVELPGLPARLHLADLRRVVADLGPTFATELRTLSADARVDPLNRAILLAAVAELPFTDDPGYAALPAESRALLDYWSR